MAINLTTKYAEHIEKAFTHDSYLKSHCKAKVDLIGAKSCRVYMLNTVPVVDYTRSGASRYGEAKDIQDTVVEYTMTQDKSFNGVVDKGDASEQAISDKSGQWLRQELREQVVPTADKYGFARMARFGHVAGIPAKPDKKTIVTQIYDAAVYMDEHQVPESGRVLYLRAEDYPKVIMSDEWAGLDTLAGKQLPTGTVGQIAGFTVVKVPSSMFAEHVFFIAAHESACAFPYKINDAKVHTDPPGISGALIEGRQTYDLFVLASRADAVYTAVLAEKQLAAPDITVSGSQVTVACEGASEIWYTTDGSDPRFAMAYNAETGCGRRLYAAGAQLPAEAETVRAVGFADGRFTSPVAEKNAG